jgi:hypothetical protein
VPEQQLDQQDGREPGERGGNGDGTATPIVVFAPLAIRQYRRLS